VGVLSFAVIEMTIKSFLSRFGSLANVDFGVDFIGNLIYNVRHSDLSDRLLCLGDGSLQRTVPDLLFSEMEIL
jgi:hypothetical protein